MDVYVLIWKYEGFNNYSVLGVFRSFEGAVQCCRSESLEDTDGRGTLAGDFEASAGMETLWHAPVKEGNKPYNGYFIEKMTLE